MHSKLSALKRYCVVTLLLLSLTLSLAGCKKDKLIVKDVKHFSEIGHVATNAYDGGWGLTLYPDGLADLLPGGDISYRGTYDIKGSRIKVKTEQNKQTFTFEIISDTEIREKSTGVRLGNLYYSAKAPQ
jgi:hypothetical protein